MASLRRKPQTALGREPLVSLAEPAAVSLRKVHAVVAAATRIVSQPSGYPLRITRESWTQEAWRQYDICGELHFATSWLANATGRCKLTVCSIDPQGNVGPPVTDPEILDIASGLLMNPGLQNEIITEMVKNLTIAGDCYLLGESNPVTNVFDCWEVLSTSEVSTGMSGEVTINIGDSAPRVLELAQVLLIRVHRPHPGRWFQADSPTRAALPVLRELEELSKYLFATISSRLAGAGILVIPNEIDPPTPSGELQPGETPFMATLAEGMLTPIEDMSSPSALVPIVISAPGAMISSIQWISNPNGTLPAAISELRKAAIERLALALDLSPDTLFGSGNSSRWGQWTIEEQSIKFHIEPVMIIMVSALTKGFLTPALIAAGLADEGDIPKYTFWYDPTDLIQRPDQGTSALNLYDRGELSGEALRRANGFQELDTPTGTEKEVREILRVITLAPQVADQLLPALFKALGLGHIEIVPLVPDGTPPQDNAPTPNDEPKPMPTKPDAPSNAPRKDGTPGEPA